ncbi:amino acid ABC transporter permease [Nordella sp. HKS 07]|uniref:amino acid ABC transporter permease n=1 Tax=Nordella sp. HKS 07 TaxID=2712222 RepID=UPI0013E14B2D|nr:amino acid ABC transporter permease [Nordella sp. HKS 07]QIG51567.1 amino acid ABC transporter permease [Nordella sp. HKS 07]
MTDVPTPYAWVRTEEARQLPPPPNTTGAVGWLLTNLFPTPLNSILTILGTAFVVWIAWGVIDWALIRGVFAGEDREACVAVPDSGACWPYVWAKFHQFVYGFYPFDQRWRVNICFIVGAVALATMAIPSLPYKKWNALFLLVVYPLMTFVLLTGGNLDLSSSTLLFITALVLLSALAVPLMAFGIEDGVQRNKPALMLAGAALVVWILSFLISMPEIAIFGNFISFASLAIIILLAAAAFLSIGHQASAQDISARSALLGWVGAVSAVIAVLVLVTADFGLVQVETQQWGGLLVTLVVAVTGIVAALPLGILLALGRRSKMVVVRLFSIVFIEVWRGVPLITVLFMASIMLPLFMPEGVNFDKLLRALVGTALFSAAYMAETVRGGLQAIPRGQYEAAQALGLSYWRMMNLIVLPQALKIVIPGIVNAFISLFKDTTLVLIIGLFDLLGIINASFSDPKWVSPQTGTTGYFVAALMFWVFCFAMSRYSLFMERRLATGHKRRGI